MSKRRRHAAHVVHHSPGRMRIRVPSAKGDPAALETIRKSVAGVPGVKEVVVSESIGTVTIHYDPERYDDFHAHLSNESSAREVVEVAPPRIHDMAAIDEMIEHEVAFLAQHSHSAKTLFDWTTALDRQIMRATNNAVDLKVLAPAGLAVAAFLELGVTAATPVWLTLGLFSFNHFVAMHTNEATKNGANSPQEQAESKKTNR